MSAVRMRARSDLRARPASVVVLILLVGITGGVAMVSVSAARRTSTVYSRYETAVNPAEAIVASCPHGGPAPVTDLAAVGRLPQVASWVPVWHTYGFLGTQADPWMSDRGVDVYAPVPPASFHPFVLEGRLPDPSNPNEIAVSYQQGASAPAPAVGDRLDLRLFEPNGPVPPGVFPTDLTPQPPTRVTVVGRVLFPGDLTGDQTNLLVTPAYRAAHAGAWACDGGIYQLRDGLAGLPDFEVALTSVQKLPFTSLRANEAVYVARETSFDATILRSFGLLLAAASLLVLGQAIARRTVLDATDNPTLRALGMTRRQVFRVGLIPGVLIGAVGTVLAVTIAVGLSGLFPRGVAAVIEPNPGIHIDGAVLLIGALVSAAAALLAAGVPAWRMARATGGVLGTSELGAAERSSRIVAGLTRLGMPPSAVSGSRLALEPGHGRTAVPVRSAIVGLSLAVACMVAALGFASSMQRFESTPLLQGITFQWGAGNPFTGRAFAALVVPAVEKTPGIGSITAANFTRSVQLTSPEADLSVNVWGLQQLRGPLQHPLLLEGRWPTSPDEIAVGRQTARSLGVGLGDVVHVRTGDNEADMKVVGIPVFPDIGFGAGLGQGAGMTWEGFKTFFPSESVGLLFGNFAPGTDSAAQQDAVMSGIHNSPEAKAIGFLQALRIKVVDGQVQIPQGNVNVAATARSRRLPLVLSLLFALAAFATLVHVLVTSIRRRRRDLAILKTIGFRRRQITWVVAWQASTLAAMALLIGLPAGVLIGRWTWALYADRIGIPASPAVDWVTLALLIPAVLLVANLVALVPGLIARRTRPAIVLRAE